MVWMRYGWALGAVLLVTGCTNAPPESKVATLYRNSTLGAVRIQFATFDANESDPMFNMSNCRMSARLLNANVTASAAAAGKEREPLLGFWCETGRYREKGEIPVSFDEAYPTDI